MSSELRVIKNALGWTNADLAKALGVSAGGVDHWFRAEPVPVPEPTMRLLRLIAEVVNHECGPEILKNSGILIKERAE